MNTDAATQALMRNKLSAVRGKAPIEVEITSVLPLTFSDMEALINPAPLGIIPPALNKIRATHHRVAQLIADGVKKTQIQLITGMSAQRINVLENDPAFMELIQYYLKQKEKVYIDVHEKLADLGTTALEEIRERLEENPAAFKTRELLEILGQAYDRSVAPNKVAAKINSNNAGQNGVKVNINFVQSKPELTIEQESF